MASSEPLRAIDWATLVQTINGLSPRDLDRVVTFIEGAARHISRHGTVPQQAGPGLEAIQKALDQLSSDPLEEAQNASVGRRPFASKNPYNKKMVSVHFS